MKCISKKKCLFYMMIVVFTILCCCDFKIRIENLNNANLNKTTFSDCLLYILGGVGKVENIEERNFKLPFIWLTLQLLVLLMGYSAPYLKGFIKDEWKLMRSNSRKQYMIWQIVYVILRVSMIYICVCAGGIIYITCSGMNYSGINYGYFLQMYNVKIKDNVGLWILVFPWLYGIFEGIMQIFLNMYLGRLLSVAFILSYNILCVYITSSFLLGNMALLFRNSFIVENGCEIAYGMIAGVIISAIVICVSVRRFNRVDIV